MNLQGQKMRIGEERKLRGHPTVILRLDPELSSGFLCRNPEERMRRGVQECWLWPLDSYAFFEGSELRNFMMMWETITTHIQCS